MIDYLAFLLWWVIGFTTCLWYASAEEDITILSILGFALLGTGGVALALIIVIYMNANVILIKKRK